jgi:hypothetical protein
MMTPDAVLEAYVSDVARRLPRAKRNDVALELQALLNDELQGKAEARGVAADDAMALELVRGFGSPEDVADSYRPAGFVIIPATRSQQFAGVALGGVVLQWLVTLPVTLLHTPGHALAALGGWWLTLGIGALWWPGFMVTAAVIAGWARHRWPPAEVSTWRPRRQDTDNINRTLWAVGGAAASVGIAAAVGARWAFEHLLAPRVAEAFAFDPDFLSVGGALVVLLWSCNALLFAIVFFEGRWRMLTRALDIALNTMWLAALIWLTLGPRIYLSDTTDQGAKGWLSLVAALVLIDVGVKIYRIWQRPRVADALAAIART